ncbi:MAG TPA: hypothetical protein VNL17_14465 [Verrucomicrobiae bacterium]|nr:hypothetical protein [Verrucomicrobiae bacterium]
MIQQFAKQTGLNPNDPAQRKVLKQLADKEAHIRKLEAENRGFRERPEEDNLTEWERALIEEANAAAQPAMETAGAKPAAPAAQPQQAEAAQKLGDVGDNWTKAEEAFKDLNAAWDHAQKTGDLTKVRDVENAIYMRQTLNMGVPIMADIAQRVVMDIIQKQFGDILPNVKQQVEFQQEVQSKEFAIQQLKKTPQFAQVEEIFKPLGEKPIDIEGQEFPDNALNRIIRDHPSILDIRVDRHPVSGKFLTSQQAQTATKIAQYKTVLGIHRMQQKQGIDPAKAQQLVEAGKRITARNQADKTRQGINAGSGVTNAPGGSRESSSYVEQLVNGQPGGPLPFSSIFGNK